MLFVAEFFHVLLLLMGVSASMINLRYNMEKESEEEHQDACKSVCDDLKVDDKQPVCMMYSRYKTGYQFFVNLCHARTFICRENLILHMVHPARCIKDKQFFMPFA